MATPLATAQFNCPLKPSSMNTKCESCLLPLLSSHDVLHAILLTRCVIQNDMGEQDMQSETSSKEHVQSA